MTDAPATATDTRDPVAALAQANCSITGDGKVYPVDLQDAEQIIKRLRAEQGYVLVNAEGLASACRKVIPYPNTWAPESAQTWADHYAAAILAAIQGQGR